MNFTPGFICWTAQGVNETVVVDAVNPSEAVFLATHRPTRILKREIGQTEGGSWCDEERLLADFLEPDRDLLLMPIVGASGTGKSHLIRWLNARIERSPRRKIVYIPKYGTNLRTVIELILADMDGPVFDEIRIELGKAADSLNEEEAPARLLFDLQLRIKGAPAVAPGHDLGDQDRYREHLIRELPKLLTDHVFTSRLLEGGGVIERLASEAIRGRTTDQKESPYEFVKDDIPTDVVEASKAGVDAARIYSEIIGSPRLRTAAVALLNEQLEPAVRNLFGMGGSRLSDVMRQVRIALLGENIELILLIEDFALLQGIQRELLDAIIEAPVRGNRKVLCPIRTAMAVTSGYFASLDTAATRAAFGGYAYSLDIPYTPSDDVDVRYAIDLVGGYLNAARLGTQSLDRALGSLPSREGATGRDWVPIACSACPLQEPCHDAFGVSNDGYGLYPFNRAALERMLLARSKGHFDPRDVLSRVIRLTVDGQRQDLGDGRFPAAGYLATYADPELPTMDAEVAARVRQQDPQDGRRRIDVLTFWGGCPDQVVNLRAGIHEAFQLRELDVERQTEQQEGSEPAAGRGGAGLPTEDPRLVEDLEEIRKWATGNYQLSQDLAGRLRRWIYGALTAHIEWNEEFWRSNDSWTNRVNGALFRLGSVHLANAGGGSALPQSALQIDLPVSNDNERLFRGLVQFHYYGHWNFERGDGPAVFRLYCTALEDWSQRLLEHIRGAEGGGPNNVDGIASLVGLLLIGSRVLGLAGSRSNVNEDLLNSIFLPAPQVESSTKGPQWKRLISACTERIVGSDSREQLRDRLLQQIAVSQGMGRPLAVDATKLIPAIKAFKVAGIPKEPGPSAAPGVQKHWAEVIKRLQPAVDEEVGRLQSWNELVTLHLGSDPQQDKLSDAVRDTVTSARQLGVLGPPGQAATIDDTIKAFRRTRASVIDEVSSILSQRETWTAGRLVGELAVDRERPMAEIKLFVEQVDLVLKDTEARIRQQETAIASGHAEDEGYAGLIGELDSLARVLGGKDGNPA